MLIDTACFTPTLPSDNGHARAWLDRICAPKVKPHAPRKRKPRPLMTTAPPRQLAPITIYTVAIYRAHRDESPEPCGCVTCDKVRGWVQRPENPKRLPCANCGRAEVGL